MWFRHRNNTEKESEEALRNAQKSLKEIKGRSREVTAVSEALKQIRERNHFAEQLEELLTRRKG